MFNVNLNTRMSGSSDNWMFFGDGNGDAPWKQDHTGIIYPPIWANKLFFGVPEEIPELYAHELAKEDYAFLTTHYLEDVDISVKYKCYYNPVANGGIVFRAVDSTRFYVIDICDMGRKACQYEIVLWLQDGTGYRRELARGYAWHSIVPEKLIQRGTKTLDEWYNSSPDWITLRVQASGTYIRVSVDNNIIFDLRDDTYAAGLSGLVARGSVCFCDLTIKGSSVEQKEQFKPHVGEMPPIYFLPGETQPEGMNAYPVVCYADNGDIYAAWSFLSKNRDEKGEHTHTILFSMLKEGEKEWTCPVSIHNLGDNQFTSCASSIYGHKNGEITCIVNEYNPKEPAKHNRIFCIRSKDRGKSWQNMGSFGINTETSEGRIFLYSPMRRLLNGRLVMTGTEVKNESEINVERKDRSVLFISSDDGYTWDGPIYFDKNNYDNNECMVVETEKGELIAFMRTLKAKNMWKSESKDGGITWTQLEQSDVSGECPFIIRHSSGALVLFNRGAGAFIKLSFDNGSTWTKEFRISPASAMIGMTEIKDGRIIILMHEGYRIPSKIRGQFFRITPEGPILG